MSIVLLKNQLLEIMIVSAEGYTADQKNVVAVTSKINKRAKTVSELCTVLGLVGYEGSYLISLTMHHLYATCSDIINQKSHPKKPSFENRNLTILCFVIWQIRRY